MYGIYLCLKNDVEPNLEILQGHQILLNHEFSSFSNERDIINIFENMSSIKKLIHNIDSKVDRNLAQIHETNFNSKKVKTTNFSHGLTEEEKTPNSKSSILKEGKLANAIASSIKNESRRTNKDEILSINRTISLEIENFSSKIHK